MLLKSKEKLVDIGKRLLDQDDRCTAHPIFQVRGLRRIYGFDPQFAENLVWVDPDNGYEECEPPKDKESNKVETGFEDRWEVITCAFSEKACVDFLEANRHRYTCYTDFDIYVDSLYRNPEMIAIREVLIELAQNHIPLI